MRAWCLWTRCTRFLFGRLLALFGVFPVRNKIPSARECEEPPGLFSEDPDCFGHFWPLAGVPGHGRILPDEAAELEPRGTEAG